jgi:predicted membrane-bound spermidine synthase
MNRRWWFAFFLVSGFCSLVCEVIWLRLAMASFGVTTALTSIVLSVFMAGLALGSWGAGLVARRAIAHGPTFELRLYGLAEALIGASAYVVPPFLLWGREVLSQSGGGSEWGSASYYAASLAWLVLTIVPFGACMGATFPLGLAVLRKLGGADSFNFSYLYLANVLGAAFGTLLSAFVLIEILGFRGTLAVAALLNALLAVTALAMSLSAGLRNAASREVAAAVVPAEAIMAARGRLAVALFATGFVTMGMELAWVRIFTPYLGNVVYSFALVLASYLLATFAGSAAYRRWLRRKERTGATVPPAVWVVIALSALLPLVFADPRLGPHRSVFYGLLRAAPAILPFSALLGFLTPLLMDRWSMGEPRRAGVGYAINVVGCILGPLAAGFLLIPMLGERGALVALSLLLLAAAVSPPVGAPHGAPTAGIPVKTLLAGAAATVLVVASTRSFETIYPGAIIVRDATATVAAAEVKGVKTILTNGIGMTVLTPITKMMAHLPLALRERPPARALVICFGMGTTHRSALSWGIDSTAVELVPSVPKVFGFYHADATAVLGSPHSRVVIDDGRRFLERSRESFDAVVIDPPPPVEAAGSSLLYSREFYAAMERRLSPDGIVQQWIPGGEDLVVVSMIRAFDASFPYRAYYGSIEGWGIHMLGSRRPFQAVTAQTLASRMPESAVRDLLEWGPGPTAEAQFEAVLSHPFPVDALTARFPAIGPLTDDRPLNEYSFLRYARRRWEYERQKR